MEIRASIYIYKEGEIERERERESSKLSKLHFSAYCHQHCPTAVQFHLGTCLPERKRKNKREKERERERERERENERVTIEHVTT